MKPQPAVPLKKPYLTPRLLVYGDLTEMTRTVGLTGSPDGGTQVGHKRSGV